MPDANDNSDLKMDAAHLYRQETYTDLAVGTIHRLVPVTPDGAADPSRPELFSGRTSVMTPHGPIPVEGEIDAANLREAVDRFPAAIEGALREMARRVQELERERHGGIVVPKGPGRLEIP